MQNRENIIFLQDLEEQIIDVFKTSKYELRAFFQSLSISKPHLEILRFIKEKRSYQVGYDDDNEQDDKSSEHDNFSEDRDRRDSSQLVIDFEVYNHESRKNEYLKVYLLDTFSSFCQSHLINQITLLDSFGNYNLIMKPLDSYSLRSQFSYENEPDSFFVIEFEMYDLTLSEYCFQYHSSSNAEIKKIIQKQFDYCLQNIRLQRSYSYTSNIKDFYIMMDETNGIQLKLNFIQPHFRTQIFIDESQIYSNTQTEKAKKKSNLKLIQEAKQTLQQRTIQSELLRSNNYSTFLNKIGNKMSANNLTSGLSRFVPDKFSLHDPGVFDFIQQHPKYSSLELLTCDSGRFLFKVIKKENQFVYLLEGKKYKSLFEAQSAQNKYSKLISSPLKNMITIIDTELVVLENMNYLLLERVSANHKILVENIDFQIENDSSRKWNSEKQEENQHEYLRMLKQFIELSYTLFVDHGINFCQIDAWDILVKFDSSNNNRFEGLVLQDLDSGDFGIQCVTLFIEPILERLKTLPKVKEIFINFYNGISSGNKNQVQTQYDSIQHMISKIQALKQLQTVQKRIGYLDIQFEKLEIYIDISFADLRNIQEFMNNNQFSSIYLKQNLESLLTSDWKYSLLPLRKQIEQTSHNIKYGSHTSIFGGQNSSIFGQLPNNTTYSGQNSSIFGNNLNNYGLSSNSNYSLFKSVSESDNKQQENHLGQQNEDKIKEFFSLNESPISGEFVNKISSYLKMYEITLTSEIVQCDIDEQQIILWKTGMNKYYFDNSQDTLIQCKHYLSLIFTNQKKIPSVQIEVKLLLTKNGFITLLNDSPLTGIYFSPNTEIEVNEIILCNSHYQMVNKSLHGFSELHPCCDFQLELDTQLLIFKNQRSVNHLELSLDVKKMCCSQINSQLLNFKNIQKLTLTLYESDDKPLIQNYKSQSNSWIQFLKRLINKHKNINKIQIYLAQQLNKVLNLAEFKKIERLV